MKLTLPLVPHAARHQQGGVDSVHHDSLAGYVAAQHIAFTSGTAANRPAAGTAGRYYFSTDTKVLARDSGSGWDDVGRGLSEDIQVTDLVTVTTTGQTAFTLSSGPVAADDVAMSVNGIVQTPVLDFTVTGQAVTWQNRHQALQAGDEVAFRYHR